MMRENKLLPECSARRVRVLSVLLWVRGALPLLAALLTLTLGAFYNVWSLQNGKPMRLSVLRLCFNTLKSARAYLLGAAQVQGVRNFYLFVVVLTVLLLLFFALSVAAAIFLLYTLYRVKMAKEINDREGEKRAKILLRAFLPGRVAVWAAMLPIMALSLFPEIFSLLTRGRSITTDTVFYVRLNIVAIVVGVLLLAALALDLYLRRYEAELGADLFVIGGATEPENDVQEQAAEEDEEDVEDAEEV